MKPKQLRGSQKAGSRPTPDHWHQMNHKQRREMLRKIQSEDLTLEVVHPDAAGIDVVNESHYVAVPSTRDSQPVRRFRAKGHGRLAEAMQDSNHSHAIDWGVLGLGLRRSRRSWFGSVSGECQRDEEPTRTQK